jgi:hypothetical protein
MRRIVVQDSKDSYAFIWVSMDSDVFLRIPMDSWPRILKRQPCSALYNLVHVLRNIENLFL